MENLIELAIYEANWKNTLDKQMETICKKYGIKLTELKVLYFISRNHMNNTLTDMSVQLNISKGHLSQIIENLNINSWILVERDKNDRRKIRCRITEQAEIVVNEVENIERKILRHICDGVSDKELKIFSGVYQKICESIERASL